MSNENYDEKSLFSKVKKIKNQNAKSLINKNIFKTEKEKIQRILWIVDARNPNNIKS